MSPPPLWGTPPRTLFGALQRAARDPAPGGPPAGTVITTETIEAVTASGQYVVRGVVTPTAGSVRLFVGQRVSVAWRDGRPVAILAVQARRAQFGDLADEETLITGGVVEQLFVAPRPEDGVVDVWFRNDQQVVALHVRSLLPADPEYAKWGSRGDAFVVRTAGHRYHVFALNRTPDRVIGAAPVVATFVRADDLPALNPRLGALRVAGAVEGFNASIFEHVTNHAVNHMHWETWDGGTYSGPAADGHHGYDGSGGGGAGGSVGERNNASTEWALTPGLVQHPLGGTSAHVVTLRLADLLDEPSSVAPAAQIHDVYLDDQRHLIALITLDLYRAAAIDAVAELVVSGPQTLILFIGPGADPPPPWPCNYPTETVASTWAPAGLGDAIAGRAHWGRHLLLLDVTADVMLWRSCLDTIEVSSAQRLIQSGWLLSAREQHRTTIPSGTPPEGFPPAAPDEDILTCSALLANNVANTFGTRLIQVTNPTTHRFPAEIVAASGQPGTEGLFIPPPPPDTEFTVHDLGEHGVTTQAGASFDHGRLPMIPPEAEWFTKVTAAQRALMQTGPEGPADFATLQSSSVWNALPAVGTLVRHRYGLRVVAQRQEKTYLLLAGRYVPRRMTLDAQGNPSGTPLGMLYLFVAQTGPLNLASFSPRFAPHNFELTQPGLKLAVYAVDLATPSASPVEILPFTDSEPVPAGGLGPARGWPTVEPLSANAYHLLWRRRLGLPGTQERDAILLTALAPAATRAIVEVQHGDYNPFTSPPPAEKTPIVNLLTRTLTLFVPDLMYWAEEGGHQFVLAWDRTTGALLLDATAATQPPEDSALDAVEGLLALPAGVVPRRAKGIPTLYGQQDGNVPFVPGPSYQLVNDPGVLAGRGRYQAA